VIKHLQPQPVDGFKPAREHRFHSYIVQLSPYTIRLSASVSRAASLPRLARVSRLIFFGRLNDALQLLWSFGPYEGRGVLVVVCDVFQQEFLQVAFRGMHALRQALLAKDTEEAFH